MARLTEITHEESYETVYSFGLKKWWKGGVKYLLEENEDPKEVMKAAQAFVEEAFKDAHKGDLYADAAIPDTQPDRQVEKLSDNIKATLVEINKSTTITELEGLWLISKGNLILSEAYRTKLKKLQNAK
jgi:hypothetical protein